jgi:hypothetical protein
MVAPLTDAETARYKDISVDLDQMRADIGSVGELRFSDKASILMHRWRYPSLTVHGVSIVAAFPSSRVYFS